MVGAIALWALVSACVPAEVVAQDRSVPSHVELLDRGVFVYGVYTLDLQRLKERSPNGSQGVTDCSDESFVCVQGEAYNFAIPRSCAPIEASGTWEHAGVRMAAYRDDTDTGFNFPVYYLVNLDRNIVYEYHMSSGITAVYYDREDRTDFHQLAEEGRIAEWRQPSLSEPRAAWHYNFIRTFDPLARCISGEAARPGRWSY